MKKGMTKVSVLYSNGEGKKFDMDYYSTKHVALVGGLLGDALKGATIESGIGGGSPGSQAPFIAMGNLYFDSPEAFANAFGPNAEKIMGDLPNFTDCEPVVQVSTVVV